MKKSAIAILTYRRLPALKAMLAGLDTNCRDYDTAIFEDCGHDATGQALSVGTRHRRDDLIAYQHSLTTNVTAFIGQQNLGVAGNSNRAIKWFMDETDADHLCLCNDDLFILGDFPKFYRTAHNDLEVGFFAFTDFWESPTHRWVICRSRGYKVKVFPRMTGIMMSTSRQMIAKVGYFDTRFGKFGEEHCDWTNRMRYEGGMKLDGMDMPCLDVEPDQPVLKHQDVETSVTGEERKREDAISIERMRDAALRYQTVSHYRPFTLVWPTHVGGVSDKGVATEDIPKYQTVTSS